MKENVNFEVVKLTGGDYEEEHAFLTRSRKALRRKTFFYPYTDEQLKAVMEGGEAFGVRDRGKLVGTFNIDLDEEYAKELAAGIRKSTNGAVDVDACYEASGLMVDGAYRGKGLGKTLMKAVTERANELKIDLCGVVHIENLASLNTFLGQNFVIAGLFELNFRYIFLYLLKKFEKSFEFAQECDRINVRKSDAVKQALAQGMLGTALDGDEIVFSRLSRIWLKIKQ